MSAVSIMPSVEGSFKFKGGRKIKGNFKLEPVGLKRKDFKKKWSPIKWKGEINELKVEIFQLCAKPTTIEDFEWEAFPKKYEVVKAYIASAIEESLEHSK